MPETLRIAVCDDTAKERENLAAILADTKIKNVAYFFVSGEEFLNSYEANKYDLIFMDIYMEQQTGVDVVTEIRKIEEDVPVAFATTSKEHALDSYRLDVIKYLEKPLQKNSVEAVLRLAKEKKENVPKLTIHVNSNTINIPFFEIVYLEQIASKVSIHKTDGTTIYFRAKLTNLIEDLDEDIFFPCHKSYIVNFSHVVSLDKELLLFEMKGGGNVYIRRNTLSAARKAYENYLFSKVRGI